MLENLKCKQTFGLYYMTGSDRSLAKLREKMSLTSPYRVPKNGVKKPLRCRQPSS